MKRLAMTIPLLFGACHAPDWRALAADRAETLIRGELNDPSAHFSHVQVTGDDTTGQTCGHVTAKVGSDGYERTGRFIVYIDATAGPFIDSEMGPPLLSQDAFDRAWASDCVKEGYHA